MPHQSCSEPTMSVVAFDSSIACTLIAGRASESVVFVTDMCCSSSASFLNFTKVAVRRYSLNISKYCLSVAKNSWSKFPRSSLMANSNCASIAVARSAQALSGSAP